MHRIDVRQERAGDFDRIDEIHRKAFGQDDEAILVRKIRSSPEYLSRLALIAAYDSSVAGHVLVSKVSIESNPAATPLALAPAAVLPEYQRKGVGSALVNSVVVIAEELDYTLITVLGEPSYYKRFGFERASLHGIVCPFEVEEEYYMVLPLSKYRGDCQGKIVYPKAFQARQ